MNGLPLRDVGEHLAEMPGNRLSLPVRIGCEEDLIGGLRRLAQLVDDLLLVGGNLVARRERPGVLLCGVWNDLNRKPLLGQISNVSNGGLDGELPAQIFRNGLRLRRRFYDQQLLTHDILNSLSKIGAYILR